ncbi:DUF4133 domain-containing protein [Flectobacillus roseus]
MAQFRTHRGVNNPPFFRGFPMNLIGYLIGISVMSLLITSFVFGLFLNYLFTVLFTLLVSGFVIHRTFYYLKRSGIIGLEKAYLSYVKPIRKLSLKHKRLERINLQKQRKA